MLVQANETGMDAAGHDWQYSGVVIAVNPPFRERRCAKCMAVAWGDSTGGESIPKRCPEDPTVFRRWYRLVQRRRHR